MSSDLKKKEEKKRKKKELHNHLESAADNDKRSYFMMFCRCNVLGQRLAKFEHAEVPLLYSWNLRLCSQGLQSILQVKNT